MSRSRISVFATWQRRHDRTCCHACSRSALLQSSRRNARTPRGARGGGVGARDASRVLPGGWAPGVLRSIRGPLRLRAALGSTGSPASALPPRRSHGEAAGHLRAAVAGADEGLGITRAANQGHTPATRAAAAARPQRGTCPLGRGPAGAALLLSAGGGRARTSKPGSD